MRGQDNGHSWILPALKQCHISEAYVMYILKWAYSVYCDITEIIRWGKVRGRGQGEEVGWELSIFSSHFCIELGFQISFIIYKDLKISPKLKPKILIRHTCRTMYLLLISKYMWSILHSRKREWDVLLSLPEYVNYFFSVLKS